MKKIISLILAAVFALSFASCNKSDTDSKESTSNNPAYEPSTLELNADELKSNWKDGVLTFANGKQVTLPCTLKQLIEASGLEVQNANLIGDVIIEPDESEDFYLVDDDTYMHIECENRTKEHLNYMDTTVVEYSFNNTKSGNQNIKFANTLTVGVGRADVEEALGIPKGATSNSVYYSYKGRNGKREKVELRINFNSDNIVNSVAFEIDD